MGRIQRKKTAVKKKSKKTDVDASLNVNTSGAGTAGEGAVSRGVTKEVVKKKQPVRKKTASVAKAPTIKSQKNYLNQGLQFLREVKVELKKVTWPTRKQTIGSTAVVILLVMIISMFLGAVDIGLSSLIRIILQ
jgi:preprotein translocase subunit SecE